MMGPASQQYEQMAREWDEAGRPELEPSSWRLMMLSCWTASKGGKHDGASQLLQDYLAALRKVVEQRDPDWLDNVMDDREHCSFCGQSWRAENCGYCTHCGKACPPCCEEKRGIAVLPNGNRECSACHKGEIVG